EIMRDAAHGITADDDAVTPVESGAESLEEIVVEFDNVFIEELPGEIPWIGEVDRGQRAARLEGALKGVVGVNADDDQAGMPKFGLLGEAADGDAIVLGDFLAE